MSYTRVALLGVLLLGGVIGVAQTTVIRIAPPPPVRVGVIGVAPGPGYVWLEDTSAGMATDMYG